MAEQNQPAKEKQERSREYVNCRLSYDCLMASTKAFMNSFNVLSKEEKIEFKSLTNYVKQLEKCVAFFKAEAKPVPRPKPVDNATAKPKAVGKPRVAKNEEEKKEEKKEEVVPVPVPAVEQPKDKATSKKTVVKK